MNIMLYAYISRNAKNMLITNIDLHSSISNQFIVSKIDVMHWVVRCTYVQIIEEKLTTKIYYPGRTFW